MLISGVSRVNVNSTVFEVFDLLDHDKVKVFCS